MRRVTRSASRFTIASGVARVMALIVTGTLMLGGCGSSDPDPAATGGGKPGPKTARTQQPDMVAAVSSSKFPGNVELRFNIPQRPVIGQPTEILLSLIPSVELERLVARFQASEGLQVVSGAEMALVERPTPGVEITHKLTVVPKADGIFNITALVLTDSPTESVSRTFSIPLIAGSGFPEPPPATGGSPAARPN